MKRILVLLAAVLVLGACGGAEETAEPAEPAEAVSMDPGSTVPAEEPGADCADLSGDDPFTVTIADFAFQPSCFTAAGSSAITIVNQDSMDHTFTIPDTMVDVTVPAGETFNGESAGLEPGQYDFLCTIHPSMTGTVTVV